jgi:hypothetical protein
MLGFAWLTLRQAEEALKTGRLEEAHRLLAQPAANGHKRAWKLQRRVGNRLVERGQQRLRHGDLEAAWHDLLLAEQMGHADLAADNLRQDLVQGGLGAARTLLQAGEPGRAAETLTQLRERSANHPEVQLLEEAAKGWLEARDLAAHGEFARALEILSRILPLTPQPCPVLERYRGEVQLRWQTFTSLLVQLHQGVEKACWPEVLKVAEQILAAAPLHQEALKARTRAWKVVSPATIVPAEEFAAVTSLEPPPQPPQRFVLWIDGVGGYLLCLSPRISLGQATLDASVDIPLYADVSRLHATLTRDEEGYLLEAVRPVLVNGQPVERALLRHRDRVTLGANCQFQFRQPAAISTSARLDLVSGHRLPVAVDAVLLMADTLLLGPGTQTHVVLPDLTEALVLYRHKDGLGLRHSGKLTINGKPTNGRAVLGTNAQVVGEGFSFAIELLGARMGRL